MFGFNIGDSVFVEAHLTYTGYKGIIHNRDGLYYLVRSYNSTPEGPKFTNSIIRVWETNLRKLSPLEKLAEIA